MSQDKTTAADSMVAYMRDHIPPRIVYHAQRGGYFMTYPEGASPRPQVALDAINEALRRGLIRAIYPDSEYWELCVVTDEVNQTTDLVNDLRQMTGTDHVGITAHRAADEIERLRAREAHLLDIIRCYNSDDALFDEEKVVSDVI